MYGTAPSAEGRATFQDREGPLPDASRHYSTGGWVPRVLVWGAILAFSLTIVGLHVRKYRTVSPVDEYTHIDYLYRVVHGEILRQGDLLGSDAMRELACRRIDDVYEPPPCDPDGAYDPKDFGHIQESGAAHHPPLYYALTAIAARSLVAITPMDNLVDAGRFTGGLWLGIALILYWHAAERLNIRALSRVIVMALIATTPTVVHATATINNDASALLAGSLLVLLVLAWEEKRIAFWFLALISSLVVLAKSTNIVGVVAAMLYLLIRWYSPSPRENQPQRNSRYLAAVGVLGVGAAASLFAWGIVHFLLQRASTSALVEFHRVDSLDVGSVLSQTFALVTPIVNPHLPPFLQLALIFVAVQLLNVAFIGASFGAFLGANRLDVPRLLGLASAAAMILAGVGLTLGNYVLEGIFFPLPPRYGLSLVPLLGLALSFGLRSRFAAAIGGVAAAVSAGALLYGLIWAP